MNTSIVRIAAVIAGLLALLGVGLWLIWPALQPSDSAGSPRSASPSLTPSDTPQPTETATAHPFRPTPPRRRSRPDQA